MVTHRSRDATAVLQTAVSLTQQGGLEQLTFQSLAAALGVRSQSLYHYFHNRDDLVAQLGTTLMDDLYQQLVEALVGRSGKDALAVYATDAHRYFTSHKALVAVLYDVHRYPDHDPFVQATTKTLQLLQRLIATVQLKTMTRQAFEHALIASVLGFTALEVAGLLPRQNQSFTQLVNLYLNEVV